MLQALEISILSVAKAECFVGSPGEVVYDR